VVYIQEAHPTDLWQLPVNVREGVLFASPQTGEKRSATALACMRNLGIELPALVDGIENSTERAYTGWPDRLYLIDQSGRIAFKSAPGPYGFDPKNLEGALKGTLGIQSNHRKTDHSYRSASIGSMAVTRRAGT
jgi:type I thyroxine 5'-deiodinase